MRADNICKSFTFQGKRYYVRGKTEEECLEKKYVLLHELKTGKVKESELTVSEWFEQYLKTYKANVLPRTLSDYKGIYRSTIQLYIGALPLKSVKPANIQRIYNGLNGKSKSLIHKTRILLTGMFDAAIDNGFLNTNPTKGTATPKGTEGERRALTPKEREVFLEAASHIERAGLFCLIIYYTGLRPSEVARITGGDYANGILHVRGSKTKSATRDVPIPEALKLPHIPRGQRLFQTATGNAIEKKRVTAFWYSVKREMAIIMGANKSSHGKVDTSVVANDLTMYCLRHDYCTRLQEAGVPIDVARRLMGHSSIELTSRIYTHASDKALSNAADLINRYHK